MRIVGLVEGQVRTVLIQHGERKIGALLSVSADGVKDGAELTVTLRPYATVTGRLVDANGKPASGGVRVGLMPPTEGLPRWIPVDEAKLDAEGRFRCDNIPAGGPYHVSATNRLYYGLGRRMEPEAFKPFDLSKDLKVESGQVVDFGVVDVTKASRIEDKPMTKSKSTEVPITGRIVDLEGRPVAGVAIEVTSIMKAKGNDLTPCIEAVKRGEPSWTAFQHLESAETTRTDSKRQTTTNPEGRFRFEGIEAERVVHLTVQGSTIGYAKLDVITRPIEPIHAKGSPSNYGSEAQRVYGADFTYTAAPGRPVEGIVRDAKTYQLLAGVLVRSEHFAGAAVWGITDLQTTTDAHGRFRLVGFPKGHGNTLLIAPTDDQPYFLKNVTVPDPSGIAPVPVEIGLDRGIWIEGRVTDKETGEPVPGAWLHYLPFLENTYAQASSVFDKDGNADGTSYQDRYQTKADGSYRLVGLPGRAIVGVTAWTGKPYLQGAGSDSITGMNPYGHFPTYRNPANPGKNWPTSMKEINPRVGTKAVHLDFQLDAGAKVRLRVVDAQGKPVTGQKLAGRTLRGRHEPDAKPEAEFDVVTLAPGEDRMVLVRHEERKLSKVIHVHEGDDKNGPVVVTLEPSATITGRVTDADGNPVSAVMIRTAPQPLGDFSLHLDQVVSGSDGRFVVPDVPIGCKYAVVAESGFTAKDRRAAFFEDATVRPGETTDVGDGRLRPE